MQKRRQAHRNKAGKQGLNHSNNSLNNHPKDQHKNHSPNTTRNSGRFNPKKEHHDTHKTSHRNNYKNTFSATIQETRLKGIYGKNKRLYTLNLTPGKKVYDELLIQQKAKEFREWNPRKSKLGAAILKGISQIGLQPGKLVLYLGCSTGTTCSHVSDIIGKNGFLFGIDLAPRVMREFVFLCEQRSNMAPILADCAHPGLYKKHVPIVDVVFQDIAQRNQVDIFLKNCNQYLIKGGFGLLAVKARSIDVIKEPTKIFAEVKKQLEQSLFITIVDQRGLHPYERDHALFVVKKR